MISSNFATLIKLIADGKFRPLTETEALTLEELPENSLICIEEELIFILYADEFGFSVSQYASMSEAKMELELIVEDFLEW